MACLKVVLIAALLAFATLTLWWGACYLYGAATYSLTIATHAPKTFVLQIEGRLAPPQPAPITHPLGWGVGRAVSKNAQ